MENSKRVKMYNDYFNQSPEDLKTIMELIKLKNRVFNQNLIPQL